MDLTSEQIYNFSELFLKANYDSPVATPKFHRDLWALCLQKDRQVAIAAPRGHAKSTAITHAFTLAMALFREKRYILIVSDTESQSIEFLGDIKKELQENIDLVEMFQIKRFVTDAAKNIIVQMEDGYKFRISAYGSGQKVRGRKWGGTRPDLIICDDLENDEMVESDERRLQFRLWFFKALVPSMSKGGHIRVVGTVLHMDSLLFRLMSNPYWQSVLFKAHESFDDFSNLLWPEQHSEESLREIRDTYIAEGIPEGYACEYLNNPIDQSEAFFRRDDFLPMEESDTGKRKEYYAGIDFAISDSDRADYTVIVVGGMDSEGILHIVQVERFKGDTAEIISMMLAMQKKWDIQLWKAEQGAIKLTLQGEMERRMRDEGVYMNISPGTPTKDKRSRARPIQGRIRAGGVRFNTDASWYPEFELELLHFPKGAKKDQVDALAWLGIALKDLIPSLSEEEWENQLYEEEFGESIQMYGGRSGYTGY